MNPSIPPPPLPPPLPTLTYLACRQKLLGLADPDRSPVESEKLEIKQAAIRLCSILAKLFSDQLDRKTLWGRIGTAFETAHAKTSDDDLDRFTDLCLEHVQADLGRAAACEPLTQLRQSWAESTRPSEWRHSFLGYIGTHRYALLTHGRARWEQALKEAQARKAAGGDGEVEL